MTNKILIVGFACLSLAAVAQSNSDAEKKKQDPAPNAVTSPRDSASGQATGKRMHKPITVTAEVEAHQPAASKVAETNQPTKKTASDDWQAKSSSSTTPPVKTVAAGDVNGDGKAKVKPAVSHEVKSPRDISTGQASGKQAQQQPASSNAPAADPAPKK